MTRDEAIRMMREEQQSILELRENGMFKSWGPLKETYYGALEIAIAALAQADGDPNVVKVVRCKDCRRVNEAGYCTMFNQNIGGIYSAGFSPPLGGYCYYGEEK